MRMSRKLIKKLIKKTKINKRALRIKNKKIFIVKRNQMNRIFKIKNLKINNKNSKIQPM